MRGPYYKKLEKKDPEDPRNFGYATEGVDEYREFAESVMEAHKQWYKIIKPGEAKHVLPTIKYADLVIDCNT